ncbi:UMP-CMP kinase [Patella vulgata]|uniref:UMP-CMP kinase n=1 Tax=Patella vulgata TaxID=6465 RepID=UPI0021803BA3|nr:UMP-CMP kinase [Patella vulgata]
MSGTCYNVMFVLGGPGAGKGTQCQKIEQEFGYVHLSAGDLLRAERKKDESEYKDEIEKHIRNGSIVPVEITCALLQKAMKESGKNHFLIDGFPRNKDNLDGWNNTMQGIAEVKRVIFFNCPVDTCVERCLTRGKTSGRADDNKESLEKRIRTYEESTMPVIKHYRSLDLVAEVSADQKEDEVFNDVKKIFSS